MIIDIESQEIVDANDVAASLLGVPRQKAIGMRHRDLHPEDQGEKCEMMMRKAARTGDAMQHVTYICDQSRCVPVHVNATPMELNGRQVMVSIVRDITEFVSEEEKLRRGQDLLRREMMERREQLAEMRKKLEDSRRLSDIGTLAASIAHELRNPLGVIRLAAFNIQKKVKDNSCDRSFRTIDLKIEESSQIIRNLLSYARVQNVEYGKLFIKDVIEEGVDQVMHKHHRNKVKFECDSECCEGVSMQADRVSVLELLFNLFDNAAQAYEDHQGVVKVVCRVKDEHAVIKVIDNGEGMDAETLTKIFDPFFTKRTYGIGLGMNVCKRIIDLHGGTIDVKSAKGEGTTVTVTLPLLQQG